MKTGDLRRSHTTVFKSVSTVTDTCDARHPHRSETMADFASLNPPDVRRASLKASLGSFLDPPKLQVARRRRAAMSTLRGIGPGADLIWN